MIYIFITLFFPIFFWLYHGEILISQPGINPTTSAVGVQSHNHWTTVEVQFFLIFKDSNGLLEGTVFLTVNESNSTWHIAFLSESDFWISIFTSFLLVFCCNGRMRSGKERAYLPYACQFHAKFRKNWMFLRLNVSMELRFNLSSWCVQ